MLPSNSLEYDFINRNAAWNSVKLGEDLHEVTAIYDQLTLATCNIRSAQHGCRISAYLIIVTLTSQLRCSSNASRYKISSPLDTPSFHSYLFTTTSP